MAMDYDEWLKQKEYEEDPSQDPYASLRQQISGIVDRMYEDVEPEDFNPWSNNQ